MPEDLDSTIKSTQDSIHSLAGLPSRYENKGIIGQGGMGMVFRVHDQLLGKDVAIKVLLAEGARNSELQERFAREAKVLASMDHPNIVKMLGWGISDNGNPYQVMELLDGVPLCQEIGDGKRLSLKRFYEVSSAVLSGLEYAHSQGIIHRDIKPGNIMLCQGSAGKPLVKIIDFGIVRFEVESDPSSTTVTLTGTNKHIGSPAYMSPEQCRGQNASKLSEIYSFACVMFECLSGKRPFQADSIFEYMHKHVSEIAPALYYSPNTTQGAALAALIERCLKKDVTERPQSALEVKDELDRIFAASINKDLFFSTEKGATKPWRKKQLMASLLLCIVLIAALLVWSISRPRAASSIDAELAEKKNRAASDSLQLRLSRLDDSLARIKRWRSRIDTAKDATTKKEAAESLTDELMECIKLQRDLKKQDDAKKSIMEVLNLSRFIGKNCDGRRAIALCDLSAIKSEQADFAGADKDLQEAEKLAREVWGETHWRITSICFERAFLEIKRKDLDAVAKAMDKIFAIWAITPQEDSPFQGLKPKSESRRVVRVGELFGFLRQLKGLSPQDELQRQKLYNRMIAWLRDHDANEKADKLLKYCQAGK